MLKAIKTKSLFLGVLFLSLVVVMVSCDGEEPFDNVDVNQVESNPNIPGDLEEDFGYVLAHLVPAGTCTNPFGQTKTAYDLVATSGSTVLWYDRTIVIAVVDDGTKYNPQTGFPLPPGDQPDPKIETFVATAHLVIPAGQTQSNAVRVFTDANRKYGEVDVKIFTVLNGQTDVTGDYEIRNNTQVVDNCFTTSGGGGLTDPCGAGGDSDGDGICDSAEMPEFN